MTIRLSIRRAGTADVPAIKSITDAAYAKWISLIGRPPAPMVSDHGANVLNHEIYLAFFEGSDVAVLELIEQEECFFIENLAVHPDWQGRGFAQQLLDHAEHRCGEAGLSILRLLTNQRFEANIAFYKKRGFDFEFESEFRGGIAVHMMKRLF